VTRGNLPPPNLVNQPAANESIAGKRLKLGAINAAIAPLAVSSEGLASLGFRPVGTAGAAKLYDAGQFDAICIALQRVLSVARTKLPEAA
jgi:hypothetical protein